MLVGLIGIVACLVGLLVSRPRSLQRRVCLVLLIVNVSLLVIGRLVGP